LDAFALERYGKRVLHLALRWVLDRPGGGRGFWGAKRPDQLEAIDQVLGWNFDASAMQSIDAIIKETVLDRVGPEYLTTARRAA